MARPPKVSPIASGSPDVPGAALQRSELTALAHPRRRFLRSTSALLGAAAAAGAGDVLAQNTPKSTALPESPPAIPESMKAPGAPVGAKLYGDPSPYESKVIRNVPPKQAQYISSASRTPLQELDGIVTPSGLFFERHHGGVPAIDPAQHRLMLHGMVKTPIVFTVEDLRRFPSVSKIYFLECSGNPIYTKPYRKTASDLVGLVSCGEWTGVAL